MKPVAPALLAEDDAPAPTLQSEVRALCDAKADHERITLPAPPTDEALRASTPFPPRREDDAPVDTLPAPPPSSCRRRTDSQPDTESPSTIPGPPRMPRIAGV